MLSGRGIIASTQRHIRVWIGLLALTFVVLVGAATVYQRSATRPIGEGDLFERDGARAGTLVAATVESGGDIPAALRHLRNDMAIEAISLVDAQGHIVASTSAGLTGLPLDLDLLNTARQNGRFAAVATAISDRLTIDGVTEWEAGDTLYLVTWPIADTDEAILMHYDLAELTVRRGRFAGIQPWTLGILGVGLVVFATGVVVLWNSLKRRMLKVQKEAELLERQTSMLVRHNSELTDARRQAEDALDRAEMADRARLEFLLMMNHELRTPLTTIIGTAELLAEPGIQVAAVDQRDLLSALVTDGRRLSGLISEILDVARIESGSSAFDLRPVPIEAVLRGIADISAKLRIGDADSVGPGTELVTDPHELAKLIASLAANASTHGATDVWLETTGELATNPDLVIGEQPDGMVYLAVYDNGPGIDHEFLPRAFDKFKKTNGDGGTGLGLYLAKMMVKGLGGCIVVTTGPFGTSVAVGIPVEPEMSEATL